MVVWIRQEMGLVPTKEDQREEEPHPGTSQETQAMDGSLSLVLAIVQGKASPPCTTKMSVQADDERTARLVPLVCANYAPMPLPS